MVLLNQLFTESAFINSDKVAIIYDDNVKIEKLTYSQLLLCTETICKLLKTHVITTGIIGFLWNPDILLPAGILGILQYSAAFVSIDVGENAHLNYNFLQRLHVKYILSNLPPEKIPATVNPSGISVKILKCDKVYGINVNVCEIIAVENEEPRLPKLAYVMQTSGTTGQSKIIKVPHQCIVPNIIYLRSLFEITSEDCILLCSPLTFDPSIVEIFISLSSGASLLIIPAALKIVSSQLLNIIYHRNQITFLQATPTLIKRFSSLLLKSTLLSATSSLRILAFGGEVCPESSLISSWREKGNKTQFYNLYGITEVSCWASCHHITEEELSCRNDLISLGKPLEDTHFIVKNKDGNIVNCGEGELYIGGEKRFCFVDDEQCCEPVTAVMRASGDMVHLKSDGTIYYSRRRDDQVKRHGKRINFKQIRKVLQKLKEIECHCSFMHKDRILSFLIRKSEYNNFSKNEILKFLKQRLPTYMVPDEIYFISSLPVTKHGKVNKKLLIKVFEDKIMEKTSLETSPSSILSMTQELCKEYLNVSHIHPDDFFTRLGGDSLKAVQFVEHLELVLNKQLPKLIDIFLNEPFQSAFIYLEQINNEENPENIHPKSMKRKLEDVASENSSTTLDNFNVNNCFLMMQRGSRYLCHCSCNSCCFNPSLPCGVSSLNSQSMKLDVLWKFNTHKCVDASPVLLTRPNHKVIILIGSHSHTLFAIDLYSGKEVWSVKFGDRIEASATISSCGQVTVVGCYDNYVYFVDVDSGISFWQFETDGPVKSTACSIPLKPLIVIGSHDKHLYALDYKEKVCRWKTNLDDSSIFSSPTISKDCQFVFVGTLGGKLISLSVNSGHIIWQLELGKPIFSSPVLTDVSIVTGCVDGKIYCIDFNGEKVWDFTSSGPIFSSPCIFKQSISIGSHDQCVYCLSIDGSLLWSNKRNSPVYSTPFIHSFNEKEAIMVVCSSSGKIACLHSETGEELISYCLPGEVFSSPIVFQDFVIIGCRDNNVYCFKLASGT